MRPIAVSENGIHSGYSQNGSDSMKNDAMLVDLPGKIGNTKLPYSNCLFPLFEAVINAIHAIQDRHGANCAAGRIDITIDRSSQKSLPGTNTIPEIAGFTIVDNGIGFTDANFQSFRTSDSTYKKERGGKGLGRMIWLKAFEKAEIDSVFLDGDIAYRRTFAFTCSESGVQRQTKKKAEQGADHVTRVRLVGFKENYRNTCPKTAAPIARRIIEHCLEFFVLKTAPTIVIHDTEDDIDLKRQFAEEIHIRSESKDFEIDDMPFTIMHVMVKATADADHRLHFCADGRSVKSESGSKSIPNIETPLLSDGQPFVYAGYVSSGYLDEHAVNERTQFAISDSKTDGAIFSNKELVWPQITGEAAAQAGKYLEAYTAPVKTRKLERIAKFVREEASQYRPLLKHKADRLDSIPAHITNDKLDVELYKIDQEYDAELRQRCNELLAKGDGQTKKWEDHRTELEQFTEEWNEHGMSKLARHVAYRKATLRFLYDRLHMQPDGKYSLEETMHEVIFPLKKTSDDLRSDRMNLWILDEKLAYHFYLASDLRFDQMSAITVDDDSRPDLLIFDKPFAFVDEDAPFRSITIVEFKRPERDDYKDDDPRKNPVVQVLDYVDKIREGKAKDRNQNTITIGDNVPMYAYIVCDITQSLRRQARNVDFTPTPDGDGYFGYNKECRVYIEIMSFQKLLGDAKKRNEKFFDELGIGRSCT